MDTPTTQPAEHAKTPQIRDRRVSEILASPENDRLYRPIDPNDPDIRGLTESIRQRGILEPLIITQDGYIVSGHRRFAAAKLARLGTVPVRVVPIRRTDDIDAFVVLLREHNRQRDKSLDEKFREELLSIKPADAYRSLIKHREDRSRIETAPNIEIVGEKKRSQISSAKEPMLQAILDVINARRDYWPLTDRQIHYALLNNPPLMHASKPESKYQNTKNSYSKLTELLTRARLFGIIPWNAIGDPTRPVTNWNVFPNPRQFVAKEMRSFLNGYWRDLMQSQPNHTEITGEKNTVDSILRDVARRYTIPLTTGRGYCSLPPRKAMADRFDNSGKNQLVLLILGDFDPEGEDIAHAFARSMRDDFGITSIHPVKVALTAEQVRQYELPPVMTAKETSSRYEKFVDKFGENVFELEALEPSVLQNLLTEAIDSVIDTEAFNGELSAEEADAAWLAGVRNTVIETLRGTDLDQEINDDDDD